MTTATDTHDLRELDRREADGIEITLIWDATADAVVVRVDDTKLEYAFDLEVDPERALEAFHHPFAYAPSC